MSTTWPSEIDDFTIESYYLSTVLEGVGKDYLLQVIFQKRSL